MSLAETAAAQASTAIKKYGVPMSLCVAADPTYDVDSGKRIDDIYASQTPTYGVKDSASYKELGYKFGDGNVKTGDFIVLFTNEVAPKVGMKVIMPGETGNIVAVKPIEMMGLVVVYETLVRS